MGFHRFLRAMLTGGRIAQYGDGVQTRDFTYVADAVAATAEAAVRGRARARLQYWWGVPRLAARRCSTCSAGSPAAGPIDQQAAQKGDMRDTYADTSRAQADLGFAPSVTLEEGLRSDVALDGSEK